MYYIELTILLEMLEEFGHTGTVHARLPAGTAGIQEAYEVWLELFEGKVSSWRVISSSGQPLLSGGAAHAFASRLREQNWKVENYARDTLSLFEETSKSQLSPSSYTNPPVPSQLLIPKKLKNIDPGTMHGWPRKHRQVYVLVDGERDVNKIASLLSLPGGREEVLLLLRDLQASGMIIVNE